MNNAAKTRAARYTITFASNGSELGSNLTEKQASKGAMASQSELLITRDDGVVCETRGRGIVPVGTPRKVATDAALADLVRSQELMASGVSARETRTQHADYLEDVAGDYSQAERVRTGSRID